MISRGKFSFLTIGLTLLATICSITQPAQARVSLSKLFTDGGVIQRDKPINVFGTAKPGEIVTAEMSGNKSVCIVPKSGNFLITLPAPDGDGPYTLRVVGDNLVEIKNLTPGEVWIVAGDADLDTDSLRASRPIDSAELPATLQLFKVPIRLADKPMRLVEGHWIKATEPGAMAFSALGLRVGCDMAKQVGGPIALIQASCPETPIRAWISPGGLLSKPETAGAAGKSTLKPEDYAKLAADYDESIKTWQATLTDGKEPEAAPIPNQLVRNAASSVFDGMIAPLTPFSVRGLIWYHGVSDLSEVLNYKNFFACFVKDFRQVFKQEGLPIIFVQSGLLGEAQKGDDSPISILRQVQYRARVWPRTYMAVSLDLEEKDPKSEAVKIDFDKLAQRVTNIALTTQYRTPAVITCPVIDSVEPVADGEALKLHLRYAPNGLTLKGKTPIKGFAVGAWNRQYFDADVDLQDDGIVVSSKFVKNPKFVRYCWGNSPTVNLFSQDGLPLVPYSSDR